MGQDDREGLGGTIPVRKAGTGDRPVVRGTRSKHADNPQLLDAVEKIEQGLWTKKFAAEQLGLSAAAFSMYVKRAKLAYRIKDIRDTSGGHLFKTENPDKAKRYVQALQMALDIGPGGVVKALREFPDLNVSHLYRLFKRAKAGKPVKGVSRTTTADQPAAQFRFDGYTSPASFQ